jgi:uncharacterized iron-regulated membrane protein
VFPSAPRAVNELWTAVLDALTGERVYLHPVTGKLLLVRPPLRRPWGWAYALHMGLVFSVAALQILGAQVGIVPVVLAGLVVSGYWLVFGRNRRRL